MVRRVSARNVERAADIARREAVADRDIARMAQRDRERERIQQRARNVRIVIPPVVEDVPVDEAAQLEVERNALEQANRNAAELEAEIARRVQVALNENRVANEERHAEALRNIEVERQAMRNAELERQAGNMFDRAIANPVFNNVPPYNNMPVPPFNNMQIPGFGGPGGGAGYNANMMGGGGFMGGINPNGAQFNANMMGGGGFMGGVNPNGAQLPNPNIGMMNMPQFQLPGYHNPHANVNNHVGFGPRPGPGTGGMDGHGNLYDNRGQFVQGGGVTLQQCFLICGFTEAENLTLMNNFTSFDVFRDITDKDITTLETTLNRLHVDRGGFVMHLGRKNMLRGMMYWIQDQYRCGRNPAMAHTINGQMFREAITRADARKALISNQTAAAADTVPAEFKEGDEFYRWGESLFNHLSTMYGVNGTPLSYVIRLNPEPQADYGDDYRTQCIKLAPLIGDDFNADAQTVHNIILGKVSGMALSWLREGQHYNNGRHDINKLFQVYTANGNRAARLATAHATLANLHYKDEKQFSFTKFLHTAQGVFEIYMEHDRPFTDEMKVDMIFEKCVGCSYLTDTLNSLHIQKTAGTLTYEPMCNMLISTIAQRQAHYRTQSRIASTETKETKRKFAITQADIRGYEDDEWAAMPFEKRKAIMDARNDQRRTGRSGRGGRGGRGGRHSNRHVAGVSYEIVDDDTSTITNANTIAAATTATSATTTTTAAAGNAFGGRSAIAATKSSNNISIVHSGDRRGISQVHRAVPRIPIEPVIGNIELDTHADTCVLGKNFVIVDYTGRETDVYGYSKELNVIKNIPIVTGATAVQDPVTGDTIILIVHEALWYGDRMDHSLINPNQLRKHGIIVNDNPFDRENPLLIAIEDHILLPLSTQGTLIFASTRTPTHHELLTCPRYDITSSLEWSPQYVSLSSVTIAANSSDSYQSVYQFCINDLSINHEHRILGDISTTLVPDNFIHALERSVSAISISAIGQVPDDLPIPKTFISTKRHSDVTPEDLSEKWMIGIEQAKLTFSKTTQKYVRSALLPLSRRYRTDLYFYRTHLRGTFAADNYVGRCKSAFGNKYSFIVAHPNGFCVAYPQTGKSSNETAESLQRFTREYGIPEKLIVDGAQEFIGNKTEFMKKIRLYDIALHVSEPYRPQQNPAEGIIREIRKRWFRLKNKKKVHSRLWDFAIIWICEIMQRTVSFSRYADNRTPLQILTGETPDISEYLEFGFYDWVVYKENAGMGDTLLGRFVGVSHNFGNMLSYWILTNAGRVVSRSSVQRLTILELQQEEYKHRCSTFESSITDTLGDNDINLEIDNTVDDVHIELSVDEQLEMNNVYSSDMVQHDDEKTKDENKNKEPTPDTIDPYLNVEITLPRGPDETPLTGVVMKRLKDNDGNPIGTRNDDPTLDSRLYEVVWADDTTEALFANTIAENLHSQADDERGPHELLKDIIDHRKTNDALNGDDAFVKMPNGTQYIKQTTKGWQICVRWTDDTTDWVEMKDMKDSYPVQLADYAVRNKIANEPAFSWWVNHVLRKRKRIIAKVKSKYWTRTHKFGIEIPKSVEEAIAIDKKNGNRLWQEAIEKEMANVIPAFKVYEGDPNKLIGFQFIRCHMIFDVKLGENFRRKARFVAGGHMTNPPATLTYSSVVSRESVRIALVLASLNNMLILTADIQNAYLHAKCREKIYTVGGKEFGSNCGKTLIIEQALYGLKSSGAAFRALLAEQLHLIGYTPTRGDPDVWIRPILKGDRKYYEYVLVYVDDLFVVSFNPMQTMEQLQTTFKFKEGSIKEPDTFLGAQLTYNTNLNRNYWVISATKYVEAACKTVEEKMKKRHAQTPYNDKDPSSDYTYPDRKGRTAITPFNSKYRPELDVSRELDAEEITSYQELIGILRWICELGRVDIVLEVALLSSHLALPRLGHMQAVCHIFNYLYHHKSRSLHMDFRYPDIDNSRFHVADFTDFYKDSIEAIPDDIPPPLGEPVEIHCFVDSSHASDITSRKSQTGILIFINRAPIIWYSKKQNSVESSTFGSEFVAMKTAVELIQALRLKLRWMGVPFDGPASVYCDNMTVVTSSTQPEVTLQKKHNGIAYHKCREAVATNTIRVTHEPGETNLSDLLTKILEHIRRNFLINKFMY